MLLILRVTQGMSPYPLSHGKAHVKENVFIWDDKRWIIRLRAELWCWRRLLRVPCTARRSNQSILKEITPEYSLEGLMLKLKLPYFGHLMRRAGPFEKMLMLGKIEGGKRGDDRGWDGWMASLTQWIWVWVGSRSGDGQGRLTCCSPWGHKESDTTEQLNWTELKAKAVSWSHIFLFRSWELWFKN